MTFLNASLLAGCAALLIPLIIHLLYRSNFQVVDWGAMHLLNLDLKVNSRRLQVHSLLLLIVRCAIPLILALCLARPVLTAWRLAGDGGKTALVLLVDNSLSLQAMAAGKGSDNEVAFNLAKRTTTELIARLGSTARCSILTTGGRPTHVGGGTTIDWRSVAPVMASVQVGAGPSRIADCFGAAIKELAQIPEARRRILLISDFQRSEWRDLGNSTLAAIRNQLAASKVPARISFLPIRTKPSENLAIEIDAAASTFAVLGQSMEIRANVANSGVTAVSNVAVTLHADAHVLARKTVEIPGNSKTQIVFTCQFDTVGSHLITAKLEDTGPVRGDDASHLAVRVTDRIRALVIDNQSHLPAMRRSSAFLSLALSPMANSSTPGADTIESSIMSPDAIDAKCLKKVQVAFLVDVPELRDDSARSLADFVAQGGALIIFAGASLNADWYNSHWGSENANCLLPTKYASISTPKTRSQPILRIRQEVFSHPALSLFNHRDNGELTKVSFYSWYRLEKFESTEKRDSRASPGSSESVNSLAISKSDSFKVLAALESGDPILAEKRFGRGVVIQFACGCDSLWSDLPQRQVFLPLMQQLVTASANALELSSSIETGQVFTHILKRNDTSILRGEQPQIDSQAIRATVLSPLGQRYPLTATTLASQATIEFSETQYPGAYTLQFGDSVAMPQSQQSEYFVARAAASESELGTLTDDEVLQSASRLGADVFHSIDDFLQVEQERQFGREIWRFLLLALVLLLFGEIWLQQRLSRANA